MRATTAFLILTPVPPRPPLHTKPPPPPSLRAVRPDYDSGDDSMGMTYGVAAGGGGLLILILVTTSCYCRRKRKAKASLRHKNDIQLADAGSGQSAENVRLPMIASKATPLAPLPDTGKATEAPQIRGMVAGFDLSSSDVEEQHPAGGVAVVEDPVPQVAALAAATEQPEESFIQLSHRIIGGMMQWQGREDSKKASGADEAALAQVREEAVQSQVHVVSEESLEIRQRGHSEGQNDARPAYMPLMGAHQVDEGPIHGSSKRQLAELHV